MDNNRGESIDLKPKILYNLDMENVKLFSVEETAGVLGVSRSAIYNYINGGELKAIKLARRTMVKMTDLMGFIESREKYVGCVNEI